MRMRITMLFAICTLLLVMIPGYSVTKNALSAMFWGFAGAFVVGIIGFFIGGIVTQPHGNSHNKWPRFFKDLFVLPSLTESPTQNGVENDTAIQAENISAAN